MTDSPTLFQGGDEQRQARDQSLRGRKPPAQVPGYRLEKFLGAGAYGEVWLAVDRNTQRQVAVKFYSHRGGLDWSLLTREVEKLSFMFADRRVVQLLEVGWQSDPPYYVMEYLERGSLEDRLVTGPLPANEALELFRELAQGLVQAHAKGLLHCDLKPANILFGADGQPRLADFGQSRLSHEQLPALGTLFYMAPEQADLRAIPHARWDVYALGAVAYRMLVGHPPYRDHAAVTELEREPRLERRLEEYRRLIRRAPRPKQHRRLSGVDPALGEIIERCLEPDPQRRYTNVQSVLEALEKRRLRRARRPLLILGAVGPALLLLVMAWFSWFGFQRAVAESRSAVLDRVAQSNRFAAEFVAEAVSRKIEKRWDILVNAADDPDLRRLLAEAQGAGQLDDSRRLALQAHLELLQDRLDAERQNWFLTDGGGMQVVRIPQDPKSIGKPFGFRDYFHGQGRDLPPDAPPPRPIEEPHLSIVFQGRASRQQLVAFSVPVWDTDDENVSRNVLGVLCLSVPLGGFAELHSEGLLRSQQRAVLVDLRPDEHGHAGSVIEHPGYESAAARGGPLERVYLRADELPQLEETSRLALDFTRLNHQVLQRRGAQELVGRVADAARLEQQLLQVASQLAAVDFDIQHRDPFDPAGSSAWVIAARPVVTGELEDELTLTGWVVMVEEPFAQAVEPIRQLSELLVRRGLVALGVVLGLVTCLWGFVILAVSDGSRRGWITRWRRRMGLAADEPGSAGLSGSLAPNQKPPPLDAAQASRSTEKIASPQEKD